MSYKMIEIDVDVHKSIEAARNSFEESANDIIRRLLGFSEKPRVDSGQNSGRPWSKQNGVTLPHGTALKMEYNGTPYLGEIIDGKWVFGELQFTSPSGAASALAVTKSGGKTKLDGWLYWQVKRPGDSNWIRIDDLRVN